MENPLSSMTNRTRKGQNIGLSSKRVAASELIPGDVLLCYSARNIVQRVITNVTGSEYTHAGICVGNGLIAESMPRSGVLKTPVEDFMTRYEHLAVFRHPDAWRNVADRVALLSYIDGRIAAKASYNYRGLKGFKKKSEQHASTHIAQLNAYFSGRLKPPSPLKTEFFCSELVVDCFIATGHITESAAVIFRGNLMSPGALGKEPAFGYFYGYASAQPNYVVPSTDEFRNAATYQAIFGEI